MILRELLKITKISKIKKSILFLSLFSKTKKKINNFLTRLIKIATL